MSLQSNCCTRFSNGWRWLDKDESVYFQRCPIHEMPDHHINTYHVCCWCTSWADDLVFGGSWGLTILYVLKQIQVLHQHFIKLKVLQKHEPVYHRSLISLNSRVFFALSQISDMLHLTYWCPKKKAASLQKIFPNAFLERNFYILV